MRRYYILYIYDYILIYDTRYNFNSKTKLLMRKTFIFGQVFKKTANSPLNYIHFKYMSGS